MSAFSSIAFADLVLWASIALACLSAYLSWKSNKNANTMSHQMSDSIKRTEEIEVNLNKYLNTIHQIEAQMLSNIVKLEKIEDGITTKTIGRYPNHLDHIENLIESSSDNIKICGIVSYGATFQREKYEKIEGAIITKQIQKVKIDFITESDKILRKSRKEWIEHWSHENNKEELQKMIESVNKSEHIPQGKKIKNIEDLKNRLDEDNKSSIQKIGSHSNIQMIDERLPIQFWISDNKKAIVVLRTYSNRNYRHAFETEDKELINALTEAWGIYTEQSNKPI